MPVTSSMAPIDLEMRLLSAVVMAELAIHGARALLAIDRHARRTIGVVLGGGIIRGPVRGGVLALCVVHELGLAQAGNQLGHRRAS